MTAARWKRAEREVARELGGVTAAESACHNSGETMSQKENERCR